MGSGLKTVNWIIDKYLFDEYEDNLVKAIKENGSNVYFYDDICGVSFKEWIVSKFKETDVVIFHGSLQHGKQLTHLPIYPGVFMTIDNYECYKYYGYFGENLLNSNYLMMGLNDVLRNIEKIQQQFGGKRFFIRPSNGYKTFAGQTMSFENIEQEMGVLIKSYGGIDQSTLVLLSPEQKLTEEYRFIVVDGEVVSGSLYFDEENIGTYKPHYDKQVNNGEAFDFAIEMSKIHQPDKAYTIDVCKTKEGEFKLLELNSFNCASMYGNDYDKAVKAINKLAIKEYNELFEIN